MYEEDSYDDIEFDDESPKATPAKIGRKASNQSLQSDTFERSDDEVNDRLGDVPSMQNHSSAALPPKVGQKSNSQSIQSDEYDSDVPDDLSDGPSDLAVPSAKHVAPSSCALESDCESVGTALDTALLAGNAPARNAGSSNLAASSVKSSINAGSSVKSSIHAGSSVKTNSKASSKADEEIFEEESDEFEETED